LFLEEKRADQTGLDRGLENQGWRCRFKKNAPLLERQRFALAEGGHRDPQHNEGFLAPNLHRKIGDAHPRLIEVALSLLEAM
jgi:hypothetical protein